MLLGSGQFGRVYEGTCKQNNEKVAIKIIDKSFLSNETPYFQNELTLLYNINHEGIVKLYSLFNDLNQVSLGL